MGKRRRAQHAEEMRVGTMEKIHNCCSKLLHASPVEWFSKLWAEVVDRRRTNGVAVQKRTIAKMRANHVRLPLRQWQRQWHAYAQHNVQQGVEQDVCLLLIRIAFCSPSHTPLSPSPHRPIYLPQAFSPTLLQ